MADQCIPLTGEVFTFLRLQAFIRGVLNYINGQTDCSDSDCISYDGVRDQIVRRFEHQELLSWFGMALVAMMALYFTLPHQQQEIATNSGTQRSSRNDAENSGDGRKNHDDNNADRDGDDGFAN